MVALLATAGGATMAIGAVQQFEHPVPKYVQYEVVHPFARVAKPGARK